MALSIKERALSVFSGEFKHVGRESVEMIANAAWDVAIEAAAQQAKVIIKNRTYADEPLAKTVAQRILSLKSTL